MSRLPYCPNCHGYYLQNLKTGEFSRLGCKKYSCEFCGKYRKYRLRKALTKYFSNFQFIRFWTFTFRTGIFYNQRHSYFKVSEIWRRFINNLRRDKRLTKRRRNVQYVKIIEFTRRGFPHYHVLFTEFLPFRVVFELWNAAINTVMNSEGNSGGCNVRGIKNGKEQAKDCANYVVKYVTKACRDFSDRTFLPADLSRKRFKLYTRSGNLKLFEEKEKQKYWRFVKIGLKADKDMLNLIILDVTSLKVKGKNENLILRDP